MSVINDGGQAFPRPGVHDQQFGSVEQGSYGMSLRDWFAGQALQAIVAKHHFAVMKPPSGKYDRDIARASADGAYLYADAMLSARQKDGAS